MTDVMVGYSDADESSDDEQDVQDVDAETLQVRLQFEIISNFRSLLYSANFF